MANWSQSHFLQSLGWATLNSFWQMALLWCLYLALNALFKTNAHKKYQLAVASVISGFAWFGATFIYYFNSSTVSSLSFFDQQVSESNSILNICLLAASVSYLVLLVFPSYRLFKNWQFVQRIKKEGLQKAGLQQRLFVQKIAAQLNITKKVAIYISELVQSPVTVGYLKPIILLPVAALNHLSTQQVEAILLHELSHIRRYDYLVNFIVSIISTLLYFNPFVKQFIRAIEEERENCCDALVLQYGYDKVGYATTLLTLEKMSAGRHSLALGAAGKNHLLNRIEKIVGMEKKKGLSRSQMAGLLAALLCIVVFNSVLIIKDKSESQALYASIDFASPFTLINDNHSAKLRYSAPVDRKAEAPALANTNNIPAPPPPPPPPPAPGNEMPVADMPATNDMFIRVAADEVDNSLTKEEKQKVSTTVNATKKVLANLQWKEVENMIADVLTEKEKVLAKQEYMNELNQEVNWKNIEQNMKAQYQNIDWQKLDKKVNNAMLAIELDSLQKSYTLVLSTLNKLQEAKARVVVSAMPDQSIQQIEKAAEEMSTRVNTIKALRSGKKVVRL